MIETRLPYFDRVGSIIGPVTFIGGVHRFAGDDENDFRAVSSGKAARIKQRKNPARNADHARHFCKLLGCLRMSDQPKETVVVYLHPLHQQRHFPRKVSER